MKNIRNLFIIMIVLILSSCFEDKGNYDYKDIFENKIYIGLNQYGATVKAGDSINFIPKVHYYNKNQEDTLIYKWSYIFDDLGVVCETREMNMVVENAEVGKTYEGILIVTDTTTGAKYSQNISFRYTNPYVKGILVLSNSNDKSNLSMITSIEVGEDSIEYEHVDNIYKKFNNEDLGNGYYDIIINTIGRKEVRLLDKGDNSIILSGDSYIKISDFNSEILDSKIPGSAYPKDFACSGNVSALLSSDNKLYTKSFTTSSWGSGIPYANSYFAITPMSYKSKVLNVSHLLDSRNLYDVFLYDETYHSFFMLNGASSYDAGMLYPITAPVGYDEAYAPKPNKLQNYKIINTALCNQSYYSYTLKALIQNINTSEMYIYKFAGEQEEASNISMEVFTESSKIGDNTIFSILGERPYMFFTDNNNPNSLYCYDLRTHQSILIKTYNSKITALSPSTDFNNLCVGLEDGGFFMQNIDEETLISGNYDKVIYSTSFDGKVLDIEYKKY